MSYLKETEEGTTGMSEYYQRKFPTAFNDGKAEGIEVGRKEGIEVGIEEGSHECAISIAKRMLESGDFTIDQIAELTSHSAEEIEKIAAEEHAAIPFKE